MSNLNDIFETYEGALFFDTETTGLDAGGNQIIELAMVLVEPGDDGEPVVTDEQDLFIRLLHGQTVTPKIEELTGITEEMLANEGVPESEAAAAFIEMYRKCGGETVLIAHNAQFDMQFLLKMLARNGYDVIQEGIPDCIDTYSIYKERHEYPHKLKNAIENYGLEGKVQNSHRAIDDVLALLEVTKAMDNERADLIEYVNVFGVHQRYGLNGRPIPGVDYITQYYRNDIAPVSDTLPARVKRQKEAATPTTGTDLEQWTRNQMESRQRQEREFHTWLRADLETMPEFDEAKYLAMFITHNTQNTQPTQSTLNTDNTVIAQNAGGMYMEKQRDFSYYEDELHKMSEQTDNSYKELFNSYFDSFLNLNLADQKSEMVMWNHIGILESSCGPSFRDCDRDRSFERQLLYKLIRMSLERMSDMKKQLAEKDETINNLSYELEMYTEEEPPYCMYERDERDYYYT